MAAAYTTTVTKAAQPGPVPDEAIDKPHHIKSHSGAVTGFKNIHQSHGDGTSSWTMTKKMIPYVAARPMLAGLGDRTLHLC